MKKYMTSWENKIHEIDVIRETEKCVFIKNEHSGKEERENKRTDWHNYFDTWEEAYKYLIEKATKKVINAKDSLICAEKNLKKILELKS